MQNSVNMVYCFIPERALPMSSFLTFQSGPFMLHFRESPIELHLEMLHFRGNLCMELCLDMPHSRENLIVTMFINMPHASFIPGRELYTASLFIPEKDTCAHTLGKALYSSACAYSIARSSLGQSCIYNFSMLWGRGNVIS